MNIATKYSIGDIVKVISPLQEEVIVSISRIEIEITKERTRIVYYSKYYTEMELMELSVIAGKEELTEVPLYEDNKQEGNYSYIKCKVQIVEKE